MKYHRRDVLFSQLIVLFLSSVVTAVLIALIALIQLPRFTLIIFFLAVFCLFYYLLIIRPSKILLLGVLELRIPPDFSATVQRIFEKYHPRADFSHIKMHVVEDAGFNFWYFADRKSLHYVVSSHALTQLNEIDIESILLYLFELQNRTFVLRDTAILVLASIAERIIITSVLGASLVHLVRSHDDDAAIDNAVVEKMRYAVGYQTMLGKLQENSQTYGDFPASFGMNSVVDIAKKSVNASLYRVHEDVEVRLVRMGATRYEGSGDESTTQ